MDNQQRSGQYNILIDGIDLDTLVLHKEHLTTLEDKILFFSTLHVLPSKEQAALLGIGRGPLSNIIKPNLWSIYDGSIPSGFTRIPNDSQQHQYAINTDGIIINLKNRQILRGMVDDSGYKRVFMNITLNGESRKYERVHRVLAKLFIHNPKPDIYTVVNHIDGNKLNNALTNLEWCTPKMNTNHAINTGLLDVYNPNKFRIGEKHNMAKLTEKQVIHILTNHDKRTYVEIANEYGVSETTISSIIKRKTWKHINIEQLVERSTTIPEGSTSQVNGDGNKRHLNSKAVGEDIV